MTCEDKIVSDAAVYTPRDEAFVLVYLKDVHPPLFVGRNSVEFTSLNHTRIRLELKNP